MRITILLDAKIKILKNVRRRMDRGHRKTVKKIDKFEIEEEKEEEPEK